MITRAFPISHNTSSASAPRQHATALARSLGFSDARAGRVALVASELATNIVKHATDGYVLIQEIAAEDARGIQVSALDKGPGIPQKGLGDGYSSAGTLGAGLGAVHRLSDRVEIFTLPGSGTIVVAFVWKEPAAIEGLPFSGISVAKSGESVSGDAWGRHSNATRDVYGVVDGLGHGPQAAEAAAAAMRVFTERPQLAPIELIEEIHLALRATRGGAVAIAVLDRERGLVRFVGVGNIGASLITPGQPRKSLASHNGTAGVAIRRLQEFSYPLRPSTVLVMQSDGLGTHWNPELYPGLWTRDPALIAGALFRDFTRGRDDSTVVVARAG